MVMLNFGSPNIQEGQKKPLSDVDRGQGSQEEPQTFPEWILKAAKLRLIPKSP